MQHYSTALDYTRKAVEEDPDNHQFLWTLELLERQDRVEKKRAAELTKLTSTEDLKMPQTKMVTLVNRFITDYMAPSMKYLHAGRTKECQ